MLYLPIVPSIAHYDFDVEIDGASYTFEFHWNARDAAWYFDLFEVDGQAIALGVKVVLGVPLARTCRHPLVTEGAFLAYDRTGSASGRGVDATFDDLGTRVLIAHVSSAELAAIVIAQQET